MSVLTMPHEVTSQKTQFFKCFVDYYCGSDLLMGCLNLFLAFSASVRVRIFAECEKAELDEPFKKSS
jgi:hypothetical protein